MISVGAWSALWWWWLLHVFLSWLALELGSIAWAHFTGQQHVMAWTLSDTIRRWSTARSWLAPVVVGVTAMLVWHFFAQANPV